MSEREEFEKWWVSPDSHRATVHSSIERMCSVTFIIAYQAGLEAAAKACDEHKARYSGSNYDFALRHCDAADDMGKAIRNLKDREV